MFEQPMTQAPAVDSEMADYTTGQSAMERALLDAQTEAGEPFAPAIRDAVKQMLAQAGNMLSDPEQAAQVYAQTVARGQLDVAAEMNRAAAARMEAYRARAREAEAQLVATLAANAVPPVPAMVTEARQLDAAAQIREYLGGGAYGSPAYYATRTEAQVHHLIDDAVSRGDHLTLATLFGDGMRLHLEGRGVDIQAQKVYLAEVRSARAAQLHAEHRAKADQGLYAEAPSAADTFPGWQLFSALHKGQAAGLADKAHTYGVSRGDRAYKAAKARLAASAAPQGWNGLPSR